MGHAVKVAQVFADAQLGPYFDARIHEALVVKREWSDDVLDCCRSRGSKKGRRLFVQALLSNIIVMYQVLLITGTVDTGRCLGRTTAKQYLCLSLALFATTAGMFALNGMTVGESAVEKVLMRAVNGFAGLLLGCFFALTLKVIRGVRNKYDVEESDYQSCVSACLCNPCYVSQVARHVFRAQGFMEYELEQAERRRSWHHVQVQMQERRMSQDRASFVQMQERGSMPAARSSMPDARTSFVGNRPRAWSQSPGTAV